ncbi:MAG: MerC family mercury resistance protein [Pseudobdellovibrionaceae bacterium]
MSALKLLYFEGCPNANRARQLLSKVGASFEEVRQDDLTPTDPLKGYASPTLLDGEKIVFGSKTGDGSGGCSLDIPTVDELRARLGGKQFGSRSLSLVGSLGSAITVGLCPVCIPAIGAFLSAIGLGFLVKETVLQPLLIGFLGITLFGLFWSFLKEHKRIWPFLLGIVMAVGLFVSRYIYMGATANSVLMYGSIAGIIGVSFWNVQLKKKVGCASCVE